MHDYLVEKRLSRKAMALAIMQALLPQYSDRQLYEALCELHNSDAAITKLLRENSSRTSAYFGIVPTSWTKAVADIKAEAHRRLLVKETSGDTDWLNAVTRYHSSMFSSVATSRIPL